MSKEIKERAVPFPPDLFDAVKASAERDGRAFKYQASQLIREAIDARDKSQDSAA